MSSQKMWEHGYHHMHVVIVNFVNKNVGSNFTVAENSLFEIAEVFVDYNLYDNIEVNIMDNAPRDARNGMGTFLEDFQRIIEGTLNQRNAKIDFTWSMKL